MFKPFPSPQVSRSDASFVHHFGPGESGRVTATVQPTDGANVTQPKESEMDTKPATFRRYVTDELTHEPSRRVVVRRGLIVGVGAVAFGIAAPVLTGAGTARAYVSGSGSQSPWKWCDKCQGLFYWPFEGSSWCPRGGQHDGSESTSYTLVYGSPNLPHVQQNWAWCHNCQGLFYGPMQSSSWCPAEAGTRHDGSESYSYDLDNDPAYYTGDQPGWRWCDKCQGLFYGPFQTASCCPKDGGLHDGSESANYGISPPGSIRL